MRLRCTLALVLVPTLFAAGDPALPQGATGTVQERIRTRLVRVPIRLDDEQPGGCKALDPRSIEVSEDGVPVPSVYIDSDPFEAVHAILIDTGPEMLDSLGDARQAALAYARALRPDERLLLATFDQRLILHTPWTTDRTRFATSADWIETGAASHLWRAAADLMRYLRSQSSRKVLVLITRGCDTETPKVMTIGEVIDVAAATDSLSVFPIAIDPPERCEQSGDDPLPALRVLAERTGGELHRVDGGSSLEPIFRAVRERLGREMFAVYVPVPFGEGPKDKAGKYTGRWRTLRASVRTKLPCKISISGAPLRCESASGDGGCGAAGRAQDDMQRSFGLATAGDSMRGEVADTVRDSGRVTPSLDELLSPSIRKEQQPALRRTRSVSAWIPPAGELLRPGARPADGFLHALSRVSRFAATTAAGAEPPASDWANVPFLVNGQTLLNIRPALARGLAAHPDYAAWAAKRARAERLAVVERVLRSVAAESDRELWERARSAIGEAPLKLDAGEKERYLGAWLGDIPVAMVYQSAETWLARRLLETVRRDGRDKLPMAWAEVERLWKVLNSWLPPPRDVRVLGCLVPGYDPDLDVVGYYRVVLAQPYSVQIKDMLVGAADANFVRTTGIPEPADSGAAFDYLQSFNFSRQAPLGARLVRWMLEQDAVAEILLAEFDTGAVHYAHSEVRDLIPEMKRAGLLSDGLPSEAQPARQVSILLAPHGSSGKPLALAAYFASSGGRERSYAREPTCLLTFPEQGQDENRIALLGALAAAQRRSPFPCVLN